MTDEEAGLTEEETGMSEEEARLTEEEAKQMDGVICSSQKKNKEGGGFEIKAHLRVFLTTSKMFSLRKGAPPLDPVDGEEGWLDRKGGLDCTGDWLT